MVSNLKIRVTELKKEKKELRKRDKKDSSSRSAFFARGRLTKKEYGYKKNETPQSRGKSQSKKVSTKY